MGRKLIYPQLKAIPNLPELHITEIAQRLNTTTESVRRALKKAQKKKDPLAIAWFSRLAKHKKGGGKIITINDKKVWLTKKQSEIYAGLKNIEQYERYGAKSIAKMFKTDDMVVEKMMNKLAGAGDEFALKWKTYGKKRPNKPPNISVLETKIPIYLSPEQMRILPFIEHKRINALSGEKIAKKFGVSQTSVTNLFRLLAKAGYKKAIIWRQNARKRAWTERHKDEPLLEKIAELEAKKKKLKSLPFNEKFVKLGEIDRAITKLKKEAGLFKKRDLD